MYITKASIEDAENILKLQKLSFQNEAICLNNDHIPPMVQSLAEIEGEFETHLFLKAIDNDSILGSVRASMAGNTCYINKLIVHPDQQNRGIGTGLMKEIEREFEAVRYELFTARDNLKTVGLYEKLGYRQYDVKHISENLSFVYMEKEIMEKKMM